MAAPEHLDDAHRAPAVGAWLSQSEWDHLSVWRMVPFDRFRSKQSTDPCDIGLAACTGQKTVMANAVEAVRQDVDQEAVNELACRQLHGFLAITLLDPVVFPPECHRLGIRADETTV